MKSQRRIIAVGDIHGCMSKLERLLDRLPIHQEDTLVFLGDYIGRGPSSRQVLERLIQLGNEHPNTVCLLGNHENLLLEYVKSQDDMLIPYLRQQHIETFLASYGQENISRLHRPDSFMPKEHWEFLKRLKLYHIEDDYLFVHAGIIPGLALEKHTVAELCEVRDIFLESEIDMGKTVVFGHTTFEMPFVANNKIGIDTGAAYGHLLTAVLLPEKRFIHA